MRKIRVVVHDIRFEEFEYPKIYCTNIQMNINKFLTQTSQTYKWFVFVIICILFVLSQIILLTIQYSAEY